MEYGHYFQVSRLFTRTPSDKCIHNVLKICLSRKMSIPL